MKKILLSLGMIALVAGVVWGVTGAFYNDEETSTGNIFTAGSIDLKVDHLKQVYNGVDCETCSVEIWSDDNTLVVGGTGAYAEGYPTNAEELTFVHPNWVQSIPNSSAEWVWVTDPVLGADTTNGAEYTFQKKFYWNGSVEDITLNLAMAADNGYKIVFNGDVIVDQLGTEFNYGSLVNTAGITPLMISKVQSGMNTLEITVRNKPGNSNPASNPAGLLFDMVVQRNEEECEADSEFQNACRLWTEKDLEQGDSFFTFGDIKPGDEGTNVISLHVYDNDAYACLIVHDKDDQENGIQESEEGDEEGVGNPSGDGELSNYLDVFTWIDENQNGEYDNNEDQIEGPAPLGSFGSLMSLDPEHQGQLTATTTAYIGLAWCAGDMNVDDEGGISCDGSGMLNDAQSDSFAASLTAYAVQTRNNPEFSCETISEQYNSPQEEDGNGVPQPQ